MFACRSFDDGGSFLRKDLTLSCNAPEHDMWRVLASFGIVVYVIGIPALYSFVLWRSRHLINPPPPQVPDPTKYQHLLFLTEIYKQDVYYYEVVELLRKLVQTSLVVFFLDGSVLQTLMVVAVSLFMVHFVHALKPYKHEDANMLAAVAHIQITIVSLIGVMYKVDLKRLDVTFQYDKVALLDGLVVAACFLAPAYAVYQRRLVIWEAGKRVLVGRWRGGEGQGQKDGRVGGQVEDGGVNR